MTNPMDGYRDIHPWPYNWSKDYALAVYSWVDVLDDFYELVDVWTYHNHWHINTLDPAEDYWRWCIDIFWAGDWPRSQMPIALGDEMSRFIADNLSQHVMHILWNHEWWNFEHTWQPWGGQQGDFVDHIHVEFDSVGLTNA